MGHRREFCPFVVRLVPPCEEAEVGGAGNRGASIHIIHAVDNAEAKVGPHGKDNVIREDVHEGLYGPWVVMACRKKETKF